MKLLLTIAALMLAGCATTHVPDIGQAPPARMPDLPPSLTQRAKRLPPITDPSLGGINADGAATDARFNDLATRFNALLDIYQCTKKALDAKDADALKRCL